VFASRYQNFRGNLKIERRYIDRASSDSLDGVTFAFVCVDRGTARSEIFDLLIELGIPFIDVGMGLSDNTGSLSGMLRVTSFAVDDAARVRDEGHADLGDREEDLYRRNTQISELNALNAALAVIKYKQLRAFYSDSEPCNHFLFDIADLSIVTHSTVDAL